MKLSSVNTWFTENISAFSATLMITAIPFPDAWCNGCELVRIEHNGWCDATEEIIEIALVCGGCYEEIKERNLLGSESSSALQ